MFGILLYAVVAVVVYRVAEMENRSGVGWATLAMLIAIVWGLFLPFGFAAGLIGALLIMFICNLMSNPTLG